MSESIKVKISEIKDIIKRCGEINSHELSDITFLDDDENPVEILKENIEEFRFVGLNNIDFIKFDFYLPGAFEKHE